MARGFRRTRHGVRARLDSQERAVLAHLFVEVYELLDDGAQADPDPLAAMLGIGTSVDLPDDPALARLLPDAHKEDPDASSEFRRYTEQGLRQRKRQALETARLTLGRDGALTLDDPEQQAWLVALTDVRLVLAERMGLRTEEDHERLMRVLGIPLDDDLDVEPDDEAGRGSDAEGAAPDTRQGAAGGDQDSEDRTGALPGAGELLGQALDESLGVESEHDGGRADEESAGGESARGESARGESARGAAASAPASGPLGQLGDDQRLQLATMLSLYDFLTWLQETLVQAVCDD